MRVAFVTQSEAFGLKEDRVVAVYPTDYETSLKLVCECAREPAHVVLLDLLEKDDLGAIRDCHARYQLTPAQLKVLKVGSPYR